MKHKVHHNAVHCTHCGRDARSDSPDYCRVCGAPVEVTVAYDNDIGSLFDYQVTDMWKYLPFYPISRFPDKTYLGEGGTPLVRSQRTWQHLGIKDVWYKSDHLNPSGSFKDRSAALGVAWAAENGFRGVICASSGNAAGAAATYASRAGLPSYVVVSAKTPASKLQVIGAHGAKIFKVGANFSEAFMMAREAARALGLANLTTTYVNAYAVEANKSVAFEIFEQLQRVPDWVVIPVGAGPLLHAVYKGFADLVTLGLIERAPRLLAGQALGCAPIVQAFEREEEKVEAWDRPDTIVSGLDDPLQGYEGDGTLTLKTMRRSGGLALAVSDERTLDACSRLAQHEGIFVEPAAAVSVAAAGLARERRYISEDATVVCLLTGHGFKYQSSTIKVPDEEISSRRDLIYAMDNHLSEFRKPAEG